MEPFSVNDVVEHLSQRTSTLEADVQSLCSRLDEANDIIRLLAQKVCDMERAGPISAPPPPPQLQIAQLELPGFGAYVERGDSATVTASPRYDNAFSAWDEHAWPDARESTSTDDERRSPLWEDEAVVAQGSVDTPRVDLAAQSEAIPSVTIPVNTPVIDRDTVMTPQEYHAFMANLLSKVRVGVLTACITGRYRCSPSKVVQAIVYLHRPNCFRNKLWPSSEPSRFNTLQELNMFFRRQIGRAHV